jgi:hypothetical protein
MAVLGKSDVTRTASWLRSGLRAAEAVGRIETARDEPLATGFLIAGDQLGEQFAGQPIFLTVDYAFNEIAGRTADHVVFEGLYDDPTAAADVGIRDVLWSSQELHAAVCLLDGRPGAIDGLRAAPLRPTPGAEGYTRAWVVGYPKGLSLAMGLEDNEVIALEGPMMHYRTATEPGSGGSPVFNDYWEVVAIHVLGRVDKGYNAGTLLDVVLEEARDALRLKKFVASSDPAASPVTPGERRGTLSAFISYNSKTCSSPSVSTPRCRAAVCAAGGTSVTWRRATSSTPESKPASRSQTEYCCAARRTHSATARGWMPSWSLRSNGNGSFTKRPAAPSPS